MGRRRRGQALGAGARLRGPAAEGPGDDQWLPLLPTAWTVLQAQQKVEDEPRVFPIDGSPISKCFTEACRALKILDLHFHDLRHERRSRLFEEGYEIQEVALVTGHRDWRHLRRYTNLKPEGLHRSGNLTATRRVSKRTAAPGNFQE